LEPDPLKVVCWRIGYRTLMADLTSCLLACAGVLFCFQFTPLSGFFGALIVALSTIFAIRCNAKNIGVVCALNYCNDKACFTTFERDDKINSLAVTNVRMLWRSSYCALIRIECTDKAGISWKQWIYAAETSPQSYSRLLRVLR